MKFSVATFVKSRYDLWVLLKAHIERKGGKRYTLEFIALSMFVFNGLLYIFPVILFMDVFMDILLTFEERNNPFGILYTSKLYVLLFLYFLQVTAWTFFLVSRLIFYSQSIKGLYYYAVLCFLISLVIVSLSLYFFHNYLFGVIFLHKVILLLFVGFVSHVIWQNRYFLLLSLIEIILYAKTDTDININEREGKGALFVPLMYLTGLIILAFFLDIGYIFVETIEAIVEVVLFIEDNLIN